MSDMYVFYRQGVKGLGAKVRSWEGLADNPTTLYKMAGLKGRFKREYESVISKVYSRCALEVNLLISAYLLRISLVLVDGIRYVDLVVKKHYEVTLGTAYKVNGHYHLENNKSLPM